MMLLAMTYLHNPADRDYLDALYRMNYKTMYKIAFSVLKEKTAAEDTVNNAVLSLFSKAAFLQDLSEEKRVAYLQTTVLNAAYKIYDAQKKKNRTEAIPFSNLLFSLPSTDIADDPAQLLLQNEEYRSVKEVIAALPDADRQVLYLRYAAGLSSREIADMIHAPSETAVQTRLSRARNKVLILLEERGWVHA